MLIPGPSVLFTISRGVALGRRAAVLTVLGNAAGSYALVVGVAAGIGPIIERSSAAYNTLKLAGALYLVWLGIDAIRHRRSLSEALGAPTVDKPPRRIFREGFIVGITNPKTIIFWSAILPQFIDPERAPAPVQMLLLGLISVTIAVVSDSAYGVLAGTARQWFSSQAPPPRAPRRCRRRRDDRPRPAPRRHRPQGLKPFLNPLRRRRVGVSGRPSRGCCGGSGGGRCLGWWGRR